MPVPSSRRSTSGPTSRGTIAEAYRHCAAAVLLDTAGGGQARRDGRAFAWSTVAPVPDGLTVFLAGGLNPVNVGTAIGEIRPFAVDVSSGVEERLRHKDADKMHAFVAAVRAADQKG